MIPAWLHWLAVLALVSGFACALLVAADVAHRPQKMKVMNVVWPVTALFGSFLLLWMYRRHGVLSAHATQQEFQRAGKKPPQPSMPVVTTMGALHCGSGCCLGDIIAEWLAATFPALALYFGWHVLFDEKMFAVWMLDYLLAFAFGIAFQYFAIVPMRQLGFA